MPKTASTFQHFVMPWIDALRARENRLFTSLSSHKVLLYATISSVAVSATIASALRRHSNFYSLAIHLSKSNRSVLVSLHLRHTAPPSISIFTRSSPISGSWQHCYVLNAPSVYSLVLSGHRKLRWATSYSQLMTRLMIDSATL